MHDEGNDWVFRRGPGFGPPFGRGPHVRKMFFRAGPGMGMGPQRRMRRGDVRFAVIDVLAEAPMHGYEIIRTLEERSGGRYSWGYPACPDLEDNAKVGELLGAEHIGVECNEETSWQYQPEQTTSALICHHPRAKYFVAR